MCDLIVQNQYLICQDTDQITDQLLMMLTRSWTGNQLSLLHISVSDVLSLVMKLNEQSSLKISADKDKDGNYIPLSLIHICDHLLLGHKKSTLT